MYKIVVLLKRAEGMSVEEFREWFLGPHVDLVRQVIRDDGRLRHYTGSFTVSMAGQPPVSEGGDEPPWDVVSEVWTDDEESLRSVFKALQSAGGPDDSRTHSSVRVGLFAEEVVVHSDW